MGRGRKLSASGAKTRLHHEVKEAHLVKIVKVDLKGELFSDAIDAAALKQAQLMDGQLILVTNVKDLNPAEVVQQLGVSTPPSLIPRKQSHPLWDITNWSHCLFFDQLRK